MIEKVEQTWEELGRRVRATGATVFVRTEPPAKKTRGGIIIPDTLRGFYEGPFHLRLVNALVLSAGPEARAVHAGDRVCFQRKMFAHWLKLPDETLIGWIQEGHIAGVLDPDVVVDKHITFPEGNAAVREAPM
jgi:co-chaperonin GroES (HSP10)